MLLYGPPGCGKGLLAACSTEWGRGDLVTVHGAELRSNFLRRKAKPSASTTALGRWLPPCC